MYKIGDTIRRIDDGRKAIVTAKGNPGFNGEEHVCIFPYIGLTVEERERRKIASEWGCFTYSTHPMAICVEKIVSCSMVLTELAIDCWPWNK